MKFYSKPILEHNEVPLADDGRLEKIISRWKNRDLPKQKQTLAQPSNRCYVVSVVEPKDPHPNGKLTEILGLVKAQGDQINGHEIYYHSNINSKTFLGKGIASAIASRATELEANMLVLDADLSPSQMRNLENIIGLPICDREAVILNVFLSHAKTQRSRNQVEIAQLEYLRPRIRGLGLNMDQQAGGIMRGRGPGETASELMARRLDKRLAQLQKSSKKLNQAGMCQRKKRANCHRIALVGYTNAGKTSLMNALTDADLSARNMPFETLDTTTRCLNQHQSGNILLSDTVGFIRKLPEHLLASFESTLAEIKETNLLVVVLDVSDPEKELHLKTTEQLLVKFKADDLPRFYVFNKLDKLSKLPPPEYFNNLSRNYPFMSLSCIDKKAVSELKNKLLNQLKKEQQIVKVFVPYSANQLIQKIYAKCHVIDTRSNHTGLNFILEGQPKILSQIKRSIKEIQG